MRLNASKRTKKNKIKKTRESRGQLIKEKLTSVDKCIDVLDLPDGRMVAVRNQGLDRVQQTVHIDYRSKLAILNKCHNISCENRHLFVHIISQKSTKKHDYLGNKAIWSQKFILRILFLPIISALRYK